MDEFVYNSISHYFNALGKLGYYKYDDVKRLLVLIFYYNFIFNDFRGYITQEDYILIDKALNCLYGSSCLIPYPDYLKIGDLHMGDLSELAQRVKNVEDTKVIKNKQYIGTVPDIKITADADTSTP
jgi:hypothetical protein